MESHEPPILGYEPAHLDFGIYNPRTPLTRQPALPLRIRNCGGGVLQGRILALASWVILPKIEIECEAGQAVEYRVQISTGAPQVYKRQEYHAREVLLLDTNGGSALISGGYRIGMKPTRRLGRTAGIALLVILPVIFLSFFLLSGPDMMPSSQSTETRNAAEVHALYTSGAATVLARLTETHAPGTTNVRIQASQTEAPIHQETETDLPKTESSFTPWPFEVSGNPETLVRDYYQALNAGQYETAWGMLTQSFQQACCALSGNDPFTIYRDWWSMNVDQVEVQSAYLQAWNQNPATVLVSLSFYYRNGKVEDLVMYHMIVADAESNRLLIDEVK